VARIRTIKPQFFTSEKIADLTPFARLLFVGLWCLADREGRLEDRPRKIKVETLPYDDVNVEELLQEIESKRFIHRYEADGVRIIQIRGFLEHQFPHHREAASILPAFNDSEAQPKQGPSSSEASSDQAPIKSPDVPQEGKGTGREQEQEQEWSRGREHEPKLALAPPPPPPPKRKPTSKSKSQEPPPPVDEEYLSQLQADERYRSLNVGGCYRDCQDWHKEHKKPPPSRASLRTWLRKELEYRVNGNKTYPNGINPRNQQTQPDERECQFQAAERI
jgi:hypothetical protein